MTNEVSRMTTTTRQYDPTKKRLDFRVNVELSNGVVIVDVRWFTNKTTHPGCVGIVYVKDGDSIKEYIGYGRGHSELDDMKSIAEWGTLISVTKIDP